MTWVSFLIYLLNALLALGSLKLALRFGNAKSRPWLWGSVLCWFVLLDACLLLWLDCSIRPVIYLFGLVCLASLAYPEGQIVRLSRALGPLRFLVYLLSVTTLATLYYIYLPITSFLTSPGEIAIHLGFLLSNNARSVVVVSYVASLLYAFAVSSRMKSIVTFLSLFGLLLALLYSYLYPFGYPLMNGLMFEQIPITSAALVSRALVDIATLLLVALVTLLAVTRLRARGVIVGILLINVSLGLAAGVGIARDTSRSEPSERAGTSLNQPIRFSKDKNNVLILFLDRFMGGFVEGILKRQPQLGTDLDGFVWYPRTVSAGENSIAGLHGLLGGYDYTPSEMNKRNQPLRDLSVEAYAILPYNFTHKGYAANLVNPHGLGFTAEGDCSFLKGMPGLNCTSIPLSVSKRMAQQLGVPLEVLSKARYADLLVLLGLMRGTPYLMRAVLHEKGPWRPFLDHSAGTTFKEWAELKSLPDLSSADSDRGNLNVVFNVLPHEPYFMGEDCKPRSSPLEVSPAEVRRRGHLSLFSLQHEITAECALLLVADYFRWMKAAGVYDNTKIVIVSDHGIVGEVADTSSRAQAGGTTGDAYVRSRSVLLVKDRNAKGALRVSEEFMPNAEVPRIVCEEIGGCINPYLGGTTIEAHGRDQPFRVDFVPWQFNAQGPTHFKIELELELTNRDPYDKNGWREAQPNPAVTR